MVAQNILGNRCYRRAERVSCKFSWLMCIAFSCVLVVAHMHQLFLLKSFPYRLFLEVPALHNRSKSCILTVQAKHRFDSTLAVFNRQSEMLLKQCNIVFLSPSMSKVSIVGTSTIIEILFPHTQFAVLVCSLFHMTLVQCRADPRLVLEHGKDLQSRICSLLYSGPGMKSTSPWQQLILNNSVTDCICLYQSVWRWPMHGFARFNELLVCNITTLTHSKSRPQSMCGVRVEQYLSLCIMV